MVLLFFVIGIFVLLFRGRRAQLWQGEEHLLLVEWDGYREYYKRFGYRDIQALVIRKTNDGLVGNIVVGAVVALFALLGASASDPVARIILFSIMGLFALVLLINALYGPTCQCVVRTAVQTEELPSLSRLRRARKVLERLRPKFVEAQGQLTAEEIPARMQAWVAPVANPASYVADQADAPPRMV
jgi:hypothetical protein